MYMRQGQNEPFVALTQVAVPLPWCYESLLPVSSCLQSQPELVRMTDTTPLLSMLLLTTMIPLSQTVTMLKEVNLGELAELHCPSNDDNHRFQFWQLQRENTVIGPTNKYNRNKYKYEVLSGKLFIKGVSSNENGLYTCVSKHISDNSFYSETIELIVKKDWEEVYETDPFTNIFRITLVVAILMVFIAVIVYFINIRTDKSARFSALADEESPDEAGPSYRPPNHHSSLDTHELDTELPKPTIFTDIRLNDSTI